MTKWIYFSWYKEVKKTYMIYFCPIIFQFPSKLFIVQSCALTQKVFLSRLRKLDNLFWMNSIRHSSKDLVKQYVLNNNNINLFLYCSPSYIGILKNKKNKIVLDHLIDSKKQHLCFFESYNVNSVFDYNIKFRTEALLVLIMCTLLQSKLSVFETCIHKKCN